MSSENRYPVGQTVCQKPGCSTSIKNHAWARIKSKGWFFGKDGTVKCPEHVPDWYPAWTKRKKR